ncbi:hypothetical protein J7K25_01085 [bacterium]|nr:hypothetical protein [bacterium]
MKKFLCREGMERYFSQFDVSSEVAVETSGSWYWFVDTLEKNGEWLEEIVLETGPIEMLK